MFIAGEDTNYSTAQLDGQPAQALHVMGLHFPLWNLGVLGVGREIRVGGQALEAQAVLSEAGPQPAPSRRRHVQERGVWPRGGPHQPVEPHPGRPRDRLFQR
jgi:hypothetical protein